MDNELANRTTGMVYSKNLRTGISDRESALNVGMGVKTSSPTRLDQIEKHLVYIRDKMDDSIGSMNMTLHRIGINERPNAEVGPDMREPNNRLEMIGNLMHQIDGHVSFLTQIAERLKELG